MASRAERDNAAATLAAIERNTPDEYLGYPVVSIIVAGSQINATYETSRESIEEVYLRLMHLGYSLAEILEVALSESVDPHSARVLADEIQAIASEITAKNNSTIPQFFFSEDLTGTLNATKQAQQWMDYFLNKEDKSTSSFEVPAEAFFLKESKAIDGMLKLWVEGIQRPNIFSAGYIYDTDLKKLVPISEYFSHKKNPFDILNVDFKLEDFMTDDVEISFKGLTTPVKVTHAGIDFSDPAQVAAMMCEAIDTLQLQTPKPSEADTTAKLRQGKTVYFAKVLPEDAQTDPLEVSFEDIKAYIQRNALEVPHTMIMDILDFPIYEYRPFCTCGKCKI